MNLTAIGQLRGAFSTRWGFLFAAIGATIGLKSIWRFPYLVYAHGGLAFLIPYFTALLTAGFPLLLAEYALGHRTQSSAPRAYARLGRSGEWIGWWMTLLVMFGIMFYYQVVIAWCANYVSYALDLRWGADGRRFFLESVLGLTGSPLEFGGFRWPIVAGAATLWLVTWIIASREIRVGLERACRVIVPLLFVTMLVLAIWGLNLTHAGRSLAGFLAPDWGKLAETETWLAAYGQVFFSLSIGFGVMIAFASYLPRKTDLVGNAIVAGTANVVYGLLAGIAVFTALGYLAGARGLPLEQVVKSGPALAFMVLPDAISNLPHLRELFGALVFASLLLAGLASGLAIVESFVSAFLDKFPVSRRRIAAWTCGLGFLGSLVFTTGAGLYWLDLLDHVLNHYGLVLVCLLESIWVGHILTTEGLRKALNANALAKLNRGWDVLVRFVTPAVLVVLLADAVGGEFRREAGRASFALQAAVGGGWLLVTLAGAWFLARRPWLAGRLDADHQPGEDDLFA